jgi:hypothetical protein
MWIITQATRVKNWMKPIVNVGEDGIWDSESVIKRSGRILEILWNRINTWLY